MIVDGLVLGIIVCSLLSTVWQNEIYYNVGYRLNLGLFFKLKVYSTVYCLKSRKDVDNMFLLNTLRTRINLNLLSF